jgi:hypothetical protein
MPDEIAAEIVHMAHIDQRSYSHQKQHLLQFKE